MRNTVIRAALAALALFAIAPAYADGPGDAGPNVAAPPISPPVQSEPARAAPLPPPQGRTGTIPLNGGDVTITVPRNYRFYGPEEANAFLQRNNAVAPPGTVLGLVAPANANVRAPGTWATVVAYDPLGYVQAETSSGLSDATLEDQVREARQTQGRPFEGFAIVPAFDAGSEPSLAWAERTAEPGSAGAADFRFEQKKLGRYGVASLTSVGTADQMPEIQGASGELGAMLSFPEGRRHADFLPASDLVSTYTVPALVTGVDPSVAAAEPASTSNGAGQTGFGGLAGWFPWIALGVIVLAGVGYWLMRPRDHDDEDEDDEPPPPEQDQTAA
jgi:uncharacterized membrane-anchored protein